jgi:2-polyprenyl-6-methoxyphenol hydroxylase-like FAD-dependent oxidoreductase
MSTNDELIVIGGGIGGLATALAARISGRAVRVLERAPAFAEIGAGLQLAPNATRVLDRLGVLPQVRRAGVAPERIVFHDALTAERLTHLELGDDIVTRYGAPYIVMHRSDLLQILLDACIERGATLMTGKEVTQVESLPGYATVSCSDGSSYRGVAAVGADGLRSSLRRTLSDDEPIGSGYAAYRGTLPLEKAPDLGGLSEVVVWLGAGMHLVQYPLREAELFNQVAVFRSRRFSAGDADWGLPAELDEAFSAACDHVRLGVSRLNRDQHWPMFDRAPIETWTTGRMALLGDAAHPMLQYLAQGACQAIEDSVALTDALDEQLGPDKSDADAVTAALMNYQAVRQPRSARVQRTARVWGDIWHVDGLAAQMRNELFRQRPIDDHHHFEWLYGYTG